MKEAYRATRLVFLAFGIGISSWAPMVPYTKSRLGLNDAELGFILLIFGMGAIFTMPLSGWLVNRFGSRLMSVISGLLVLTILPLLTIAPTYLLLGVALFLFGAVTSAMNIAINAQAITVESKSSVPLMSGFHCFFSTGGLLGVVLVGLLLELKLNLFYCGLTVALIMALLVISQWKKLLQEAAPPSNVSKTLFTFPESRVILLGLLCFVAFMAEGSMLDWSAEFLRSSLDYAPAHAGIGYALFSIAMAFGRFLGDKFIARFGVFATFQGGGLLAASGFLIFVNLSSYAELVGFLLVGLGASNLVPILFSASGKCPNTSSHYALTIVTSFGYAGLLLGPGVIGLVANTFTLSLALTGVALAMFLVGLCGSKLALKPAIHVNSETSIS